MDYPQAIVASTAIAGMIVGILTAILKFRKGNNPGSKSVHEVVTKEIQEFRDGTCAERSGGIEAKVEMTGKFLSDKIDETQRHTKSLIDTQQLIINDKFELVLREVKKRVY
jgi:hypothetical protein